MIGDEGVGWRKDGREGMDGRGKGQAPRIDPVMSESQSYHGKRERLRRRDGRRQEVGRINEMGRDVGRRYMRVEERIHSS